MASGFQRYIDGIYGLIWGHPNSRPRVIGTLIAVAFSVFAARKLLKQRAGEVHQDVYPVSKNLWIIKSNLFMLRSTDNVIVYKTPDDRIVLHNLVPLSAGILKQISQFGKIDVVIIPDIASAFHLRDVPTLLLQSVRLVAPLNIVDKVERIVGVGHVQPVEKFFHDYPGVSVHQPQGYHSENWYEFDLQEGERALVCSRQITSSSDGKHLYTSWSFTHFGLHDRKLYSHWLQNLVNEIAQNLRVVVSSQGDPVIHQCGPKLIGVAEHLI